MGKFSLFIVSIIAFVVANAISKNNKTCLFSAVSGTIKLNGEPVANARIKRVSGEHIDEAKTDENGYFNMPSVFDTSISNAIRKFVPSQFVSPQTVYVYVDGIEYQILDAVKRREKEFSESRGKPWIVTCELKDEENLFKIDGSPFATKCKWAATHDRKMMILPPSGESISN